jgi:preprotein translocase subunit SecF
MEFFRQVNLDWMGKAKYFFALSLSLLLIGGISWVSKGRTLRYGIDFKEGTLVYVRFAHEPPIDQIRKGLAQEGLGNSVIQRITDISNPNSNEVAIGLEEKGQSGQQALDAGKTAILQALRTTFGAGDASKQDLNEATSASLAEFLSRRDPLALGPTASDRYTLLARRITGYRDKERNGLISSLDELKKVEGVNDAVLASLRDTYYLGNFIVRNVEIVGPKVGAELRKQAVYVTLYALAGMLVYIAFRFEWVYGAAAVLAVFHDVLITLGFFSLLNFEISLTVIAALLTLVGYSMNDTIVIFDRIRENNRLMRREPFAAIVNRSINQTLSRTILTSGLTFLTVLVLFLMGGQVLRSFSFALVVGIVVGTYSSFGIAAPLVVAWNHWRGPRAAAGTGSAAGNKTRAGEAASGRLAAAGRR